MRTLVDTLVSPIAVFRRLRESPQVALGLVTAAVGQAVVALGTGQMETYRPMDLPLESPGPVGGLVLALFVFLLTVCVLHGSAQLMRGRGSFSAAISALGLASLPLVLFAPVFVFATLTGLAALSVTVKTLLGLWSVVLNVVAVREVYQISTARALGVFFVGLVGVTLLFVGVVVVVGVFAALTAL